MSSRIEMLKAILERQPEDEFAQYALALEYVKTGEQDRAAQLFAGLIDQSPDYLATYYQYGVLLKDSGRETDAADILRKGVEVAERAGETHTKEELLEALGDLDLDDQPGCEM